MLKSLLNTKNYLYFLIIPAALILMIIFIAKYQNTANKEVSLADTGTPTETVAINTASTSASILADNQDKNTLNDKRVSAATSVPQAMSPAPPKPSDAPPVANDNSPAPSTPLAELPSSIRPRETMAWIYPGGASCGAVAEYSDGRKIDILKPEYFTISEEGELILLSEENRGCNGYSARNVAGLKKHSKEQYVTISSSYAVSMDLFLTASLENSANIDTLIAFTVDNNLTGLEIDFEDFGGWNSSSYQKYKEFITKLGSALHAKSKKLMVAGPETANSVEEAWYVWRYADFNSLPVDRLVIMLYDYQYDQGVGQPVAPLAWIQETIKFTLGRFSSKARLSVGVPSYGYRGLADSNKFSLLTYEQIKKEPGFLNAKRDPNSWEMTWEEGGYIYFYQDAASLLKKIQTIKDAGVDSVSIWHLGGNLWF